MAAEILMTPRLCEIGRHFVHYLRFSDTHILADGHFPFDLARLRKNELKHYSTSETVPNRSPLHTGFSRHSSAVDSAQCHRKG